MLVCALHAVLKNSMQTISPTLVDYIYTAISRCLDYNYHALIAMWHFYISKHYRIIHFLWIPFLGHLYMLNINLYWTKTLILFPCRHKRYTIYGVSVNFVNVIFLMHFCMRVCLLVCEDKSNTYRTITSNIKMMTFVIFWDWPDHLLILLKTLSLQSPNWWLLSGHCGENSIIQAAVHDLSFMHLNIIRLVTVLLLSQYRWQNLNFSKM